MKYPLSFLRPPWNMIVAGAVAAMSLIITVVLSALIVVWLVQKISTLPAPWNLIASGVVAAVVLITFMALSALFFIWLERKVSARMQDRLGPTRTGGRFGWAQTIADGIKLLTKEDTDSAPARIGFCSGLAPYIAFCASFVAFLVLPFSVGFVGQKMQVAAFFMLAVLSSEVFGVILAGYASASKWSLFGGIREAAQVVSYEVPRAMCVLIPIILAGTLNLNTIGRQQGGFFWNWAIFHDPFTFGAFWIFFICATASCKRTPFDLAEAESELVAGFHTEYSGLRWSFFFMAEYGSMFAVSGLAALLFLGGWHTGFLPVRSERAVWIAGTLAGHRRVRAERMVPGFPDDVDALVAAAFAHRSSDDDLPEVFPADLLRFACWAFACGNCSSRRSSARSGSSRPRSGASGLFCFSSRNCSVGRCRRRQGSCRGLGKDCRRR